MGEVGGLQGADDGGGAGLRNICAAERHSACHWKTKTEKYRQPAEHLATSTRRNTLNLCSSDSELASSCLFRTNQRNNQTPVSTGRGVPPLLHLQLCGRWCSSTDTTGSKRPHPARANSAGGHTVSVCDLKLSNLKTSTELFPVVSFFFLLCLSCFVRS